MIDCIDGTALPIDKRALERLLTGDYFRNWHGLRFDADYLAALPSIHRGTPVKQFFTDSAGTVRRIGWFLSMYDEASDLPGPRQVDHMYYDGDTRVIDRSLPYLLDCEHSKFSVESPVRFYPFAALYEDPFNDETMPFTLAHHFRYGNDSVCFDTSTNPFSIVYCNFDKACKEYDRYDSDSDNVYDYSHLIFVANSFPEFARKLRNRAVQHKSKSKRHKPNAKSKSELDRHLVADYLEDSKAARSIVDSVLKQETMEIREITGCSSKIPDVARAIGMSTIQQLDHRLRSVAPYAGAFFKLLEADRKRPNNC